MWGYLGLSRLVCLDGFDVGVVIGVLISGLCDVLAVRVAVDETENPVSVTAAAEDRCRAAASVDVQLLVLRVVRYAVNFHLDALRVHTIEDELFGVGTFD